MNKAKSAVKVQDTNDRQKVTASVKLPNIKLGKFTRNPLEWNTFWDLYKTSIHDRTDIGSPAKFHYLISQLEGDAVHLLSGFDHTINSYQEAIDLLQSTYGNKNLLIQTLLNSIFVMESPLPTSTSLSKIWSLYEGHLRALQSLGSNITEAGYVYAEILVRNYRRKQRTI